ncbi:MAG: DUF503 domain-containing protein [Desulfosudaceae bacterium]
MVIGTGVIILHIDGCRSLKEKRKVVKSLIDRLDNAFNISVAETADQDRHQQAQIGFALVGNDRRVINARIDKIFNLAEEIALARISHTEMEIFTI